MTLFGFSGTGSGGGMFTMILLYGLIIAVFYFILIRPQSKQKKKGADRNKLKLKKWAIGSNESKRNAPKTDDKKDAGEKKGFFSFLKK